MKMHTAKQYVKTEQDRRRVWIWLTCEAFALYSMLRSLRLGSVSDAFVCLLVGVGMSIPCILEEYGYRMSYALFIFSLFYMLASLSGRIYKLYYLVAHWDKLLHLCGGVLFALLGSYIPVLLNKKHRDDRLLRILFAVLFSISISALWEFYEFGMDSWFGMDMQRDTVIDALHSYNLGEATGIIGNIDHIDSTVVNGQPLEGYIDIGLIDTMGDMMIETAGAVFYAVVFALDKGQHSAFSRVEPSCREVNQTAHV